MSFFEELNKESVILLLIEGIFLCGSGFFLNTYYNQLINFEDIKWEKEEIQCLSDNCATSRQRINVYRFGKDINNVKLSFKITDSNYEIQKCLVVQYERSILDFAVDSKPMNPAGRRISFEDSELNEKNSCNYELSALSTSWTYQMVIDVIDKKGGKPLNKFGVFQIEDSDYTRYDHANLGFQDYLRLYLVQFIVTSIFLIFILTFLIFLTGKHFSSPSLRRKVK